MSMSPEGLYVLSPAYVDGAASGAVVLVGLVVLMGSCLALSLWRNARLRRRVAELESSSQTW